jgi:predicted SprT family Zn-dependent metalloprotease
MSRCLEIAQLHYGRRFPRSRVSYQLRGLCAGKANPSKWLIKLNTQLMATHPDQMIRETLPHELAHLVDAVVNPQTRIRRTGAKRSIHGPTWQGHYATLWRGA